MLMFVNVIALLTKSRTNLGKILNSMENMLSIHFSIKINKGTTEVIIYYRCKHRKLNIRICNEKIQKIQEFYYLKNKIIKDGRS